MGLLSFSKSKKLRGVYSFGTGFVAASFDFKDDSVLYASYFSDDGYIVVEQKGIYKIRNKKLSIRFVNEIKITPDCLIKRDSAHNDIDSLVILTFHIHDNGEPLIGVNVSTEDTHIGSITDTRGTCTLQLDKNSYNKIIISYVVYENEEVSFNNSYNYDFDVCLKMRNIDLSGTVKKHPIKSIKEDGFLAKVWNTKNWEKFKRK